MQAASLENEVCANIDLGTGWKLQLLDGNTV